MKLQLGTIFLALVVGYLGGLSSQLFTSGSAPREHARATPDAGHSGSLQTKTELAELQVQLARLQKKTDRIEMQLNEVARNRSTDNGSAGDKSVEPVRQDTRQSVPVAPNKADLVAAGVDPAVADDILRRISQQEYRRLEIQNLLQRNSASDTRQYVEELRELNQNSISLRSELGDDAYDQYLVASGQHNRVKVLSVMAGSPAELNGIQTGDVILYYDDQNIFNPSDLRAATLQGEIGSFASVAILRDGVRMDVVVPRGTLGVQMEALQMQPAQRR